MNGPGFFVIACCVGNGEGSAGFGNGFVHDYLIIII